MPRLKPDEIIALVDQQQADTQLLRTRMESDYSLYRLDKFLDLDPTTGEPVEGFANYTSNAPRTFANKVISWLVQAELLLRVPHLSQGGHAGEMDNAKERFAIGCLRAADERLVRMLQPRLKSQLAFHTSVRGGMVGGRCLLVKRQDGSTYVDITPWDPLHIYWSLGRDGLDWVCYMVKKAPSQIRAEYGVTIPGGQNGTDPEQHGVAVYDFYDAEINRVVIEGKELKKPTRHGSPRVPAYMVAVGNAPLIQSTKVSGTIQDMGESIYEASRGTYEQGNLMKSVMLELVARARKQGITVRSRDGRKTLAENPYVQGAEISLAEGEEVKPLGLMEMARETGAFMGIVSGEEQRATLPFTAYGEVQFQLSGYAINTLRQGIESILQTRLQAMEDIYLQVVNLLHDQYLDGAFEPMRLSGRDSHRAYFSEQISPEVLRDTCDYRVKLVSQLPQDDMTRVSMAQMLREGPTPLVDDLHIRDDYLGLQDSEQVEQAIRLQLAERALPEASLYTLMVAAETQGRRDLAAIYFKELMGLVQQKMVASGMMPPTPEGPGPGGPTARPEVLPNVALGVPPSPAQSTPGPQVPPGTLRPGAQGEDMRARLQALGLVPP